MDSTRLMKIANQLRIHSIRATTSAGSGHPTSCCSAADLLAGLFFGHMRFIPSDPHFRNNDRFILSKGHAAPLLYAAWAEAGAFPLSYLESLRRLESPLEGHPTPRLAFVDVATGSLGQGLSAGVGIAVHARLEGLSYRTYVLMGDGELAEGSVWEAASQASLLQLGNLTAILDINRLGQSRPTPFEHHLEIYQKRFEAFGWKTVLIDGHDMDAILRALSTPASDRPLAIIAKTIKGKGIPGIEDQLDWHGKPLPEAKALEVIQHLEQNAAHAEATNIQRPAAAHPHEKPTSNQVPAPEYKKGEQIAPRKAFGQALERLATALPNIMVLDGDVSNSTYTDIFGKAHPERFIECYIAEQNMVGMASGLAAMGKIPFCATFGAFFCRAYDQIRMAAISQNNLKLVGTHSGVSIGEDGASQMGLEDVATMRAIPGSKVLCPSDAMSTERLVEIMAQEKGIFYLRAARADLPVIYGPDEKFEIGGAKILRQSSGDRVTVVASGVTLPEAIKACDLLARKAIGITVIDAYSIKPLGKDRILEAALRTNKEIITVEDHYIEGGLGEAVACELHHHGVRVHCLAVKELPHSGKKSELMKQYGIDADAIVDRVLRIIGNLA